MRMATALPRRRSEDDAGAALIMSVIVMTILVTLSIAVLGRTLSVLNFVRSGQDFDAALAAADAGVADALFKIDQSAPANWTATGATGSGSFQYWATKLSDSRYVVASVGVVGKSKHGVQVRVDRSAQFPYALFSRGPLHLDGSTSAGNVKVGFYALAGTGDIRVGSNSTVVCNGTLPPDLYIDWFQTQSECAAATQAKLEKPRDMSIRIPPPPAGNTDPNWENCPTGGMFGSLLATGTVTIDGADGPFVCRRNVTFVGTIAPKSTAPPVQIYIAPRHNTDGTTTTYSLDKSTAVVNPTQPAARFQVYKVGAQPIYHNAITDLTFRGVLFAPDTALTINGGHLSWAGSITVGQLKVNGAPNLKIGYDFDLATYLGPDWKVSRYREIPSSEAGFLTVP